MFNNFRGRKHHGIPEYSVDDDYDYDPIPHQRLLDKSGPSRLRTSLSYSTISSHLTVASTSSSSSSSDQEPPYPPTPSYTSESLPATPSSTSPSSFDSKSPLPFDLSPLRPKRKPWSGRGSQDSGRMEVHEELSRKPPVYVRDSPTSVRRPLPLLPISPTPSSINLPLLIPVDHPPPYSAIQPSTPPDHHHKPIRPLPKLPSRKHAAAPRPDLSAVSPPQSFARIAQLETWASAEEGLRQVPVTEVIDWDAVEAAMLSADSDEEDSDSTLGPS